MGQNTKEIKKRIISVKNTRKITRTMEMVSTAKSKKAQDRVHASQPYNQKIRDIIGGLAQAHTSIDNDLLKDMNRGKPYLILVIASNRGLCGAYNSNVLKLARDKYREYKSKGQEVQLEVVGKKGISFFRFNEVPVTKSYLDISDNIQFESFEKIPDDIMSRYLNGEIDRFFVVYTKYISSAKQVATIEQFLPFRLEDILSESKNSPDAPDENEHSDQNGKNTMVGTIQANYIYEPNANEILNQIVPFAFKMNVFQSFLEAFTAEHIYRRIAMKSATDAAGDMIRSLSSSYNRARQAKITQEIAEIINGVNALSG